MHPLVTTALLVAAWEGGWWARRRALRGSTYERALARSRETSKPLVVIGAPDAGVTAGYPCGDITVDLQPFSRCPRYLSADIAERLPFQTGSVVAYVSCVLEYVDRYPEALTELRRIAGPDLFVVRVEPWTLAAHLYPGAKRTLPSSLVTR